MTKKEFLKQYENIPDYIENPITMTEANCQIKIYEGEYILKTETEEFKINGTITFDWVANLGAHFTGSLRIPLQKYVSLSPLNSYEIIVNGLTFGKASITNTTIGDLEGITIRGRFSQEVIFGDKSISVEKLIFSIPNLKEFEGLNVKRAAVTKFSIFRSRLTFENDNYIIRIDKCEDFKAKLESLEEKGGYIILYNGELTSKKGAISFKETKDIFHCLDTFLTFLNGRRTSAVFLQGICQSKIIWCDYSNYFIDNYKIKLSWSDNYSVDGFNELWQKFSLLWKSPENKNFLTSAVHWYTESNNQVGFSEGSIIMAQTALELLYNWWVIEQKKIIAGKDSETISATNKIRLLLSQLNISYNIPTRFKELQQFVDQSKDVLDGPDAVVQIRNAIVHSQEEKRKKLSSIHHLVKFQALQLCVWYIEMALLHILEFDGIYFNRCSSSTSVVDARELVPWTKRKL